MIRRMFQNRALVVLFSAMVLFDLSLIANSYSGSPFTFWGEGVKCCCMYLGPIRPLLWDAQGHEADITFYAATPEEEPVEPGYNRDRNCDNTCARVGAWQLSPIFTEQPLTYTYDPGYTCGGGAYCDWVVQFDPEDPLLHSCYEIFCFDPWGPQECDPDIGGQPDKIIIK